LGENVDGENKERNTERVIVDSKEVGLKVDAEKAECMLMPFHHILR
jgi:hypothetical protein